MRCLIYYMLNEQRQSEMNSMINLNYRGTSLPIKLVDGEPWVNLNAMGKPFAKEPAQWLRTDGAVDYISALELLDNDQNAKMHSGEIAQKKALSVQNGGKNPGTWASELVALEFARWCDPAFAIWCNRQLRELVTMGKVKVDMQRESLRLKWDQTLLMIKNGQKWGQRFQDFLRECEKPDGDRDPRTRYSDMIAKLFSYFGGESYEFRKDVIHKMRANFHVYKAEYTVRTKSKNKFLDMVMLMDVERELENLWARYEASSRAQTLRHIKSRE